MGGLGWSVHGARVAAVAFVLPYVENATDLFVRLWLGGALLSGWFLSLEKEKRKSMKARLKGTYMHDDDAGTEVCSQ